MGTASLEVESKVHRRVDNLRSALNASWEYVFITAEDVLRHDLEAEGPLDDVPSGSELKAALERRTEDGVRASEVVVISSEELGERVERARESGYQHGYEEAVVDNREAKREALIRHGICHRCREANAESLHHIIPRVRGGSDDLGNRIPLCDDCHNRVEVLTEKLLDGRSEVSAGELRGYIENQFPVGVYG